MFKILLCVGAVAAYSAPDLGKTNGNECCHESCDSDSDCFPGLFCCPNHNECMDTTTKSTVGPNCDAASAGGCNSPPPKDHAPTKCKAVVEYKPQSRTKPFKYVRPIHKKPPGWKVGDGFCDYIWDDLPDECDCDDRDYGGIVECDVDLMGLDTVGVKIDIEPCAEPMKFEMDITESDLGIDYPIVNIGPGTDEHVPIPGLSIDLPGVGDAGVDAIISLDGNIDELTLGFGVDACVDTPIGDACGADIPITGNPFPIMLLDATYDFGDLC